MLYLHDRALAAAIISGHEGHMWPALAHRRNGLKLRKSVIHTPGLNVGLHHPHYKHEGRVL